ncbi:MAG: hypothetical protein HC886_08975 [Leptolyngbyaceae cyanobacterium SM1_1_3]|nr:hypothetical protein [Leptolyngbyaceae cyanobacterium SM1_1_3]NJM85392.1 hypothetical protein [Leptolyngbyaceae cyanobacterium RM2_2_21]NJN04140.1 hypothetical protein [Leptolyngbyaceae cyanobacterium RM1_1_2]NJO11394.1 hypothetical protein [Leptolyngbyaceae cyanobacterium SL_1_1]
MQPSDSTLVRELYRKSARLRQFKASLDSFVQSMLDECEWGIIAAEGQGGLPLMTLRLQERIDLHDPFLVTLAEQAERYYGPIDFALFTWETSEPLRVLSKTLLDTKWRRRNH